MFVADERFLRMCCSASGLTPAFDRPLVARTPASLHVANPMISRPGVPFTCLQSTRLTPADSKQAEHTYVHTSCLAERVSMTQTSNASFLPQKHICADSTRSLLTSERTSVFSVTSAAAPVGYHICLYNYLPSASAAVSPMCHPSRASGLLSALFPVSRLALRTELRHLTCNASITQSDV